jgi:hypothetical protein
MLYEEPSQREPIRLLRRMGGAHRFVAHIPDVSGYPLCGRSLKLYLWHIVECDVTNVAVCRVCQVTSGLATPECS